jgi:hypothetical protein
MNFTAIADKGEKLIEPQTDFELKFENLNKGEKIRWEWSVEEFKLDFRIEDSNGFVYYEIFDSDGDKGSFIVPKLGTWVLIWDNAYFATISEDFSIKLEYSVMIEKIPPLGLWGKPGNGIVDLEWNAVEGSDGYNVYRSTSPDGGFEKVNDDPVENTTFEDDEVTNDVTYYYYVTSLKNETESDPSNIITAKPLGDDLDGDGVPDEEDQFPNNPSKWQKPPEKETVTETASTASIGSIGILVVILIVAIILFLWKKMRK